MCAPQKKDKKEGETDVVRRGKTVGGEGKLTAQKKRKTKTLGVKPSAGNEEIIEKKRHIYGTATSSVDTHHPDTVHFKLKKIKKKSAEKKLKSCG